MKKLITLSLALVYFTILRGADANGGHDIYGNDASKIFFGASHLWIRSDNRVPDLIEMSATSNIEAESFFATLTMVFHLPSSYGYTVITTEHDQYGWEHRRCQLTVNGVAVTDGIFLMHMQNGKVIKYNGYLPNVVSIAAVPQVPEANALSNALNDIKATQYKWQVPGENEFLQKMTNDANATYYPKGELMAVQKYDELGTASFHLAWRFDIYARQPVSRNYVYVDAVTGEVLRRDSRMETANTTATGHTVYRGNRTIKTDSYNGAYRLRETTRGNGINTYNMQAGTNYNSATDFTNVTTTWNNINANLDQYATDAHWGGEMTSDFYTNTFGRNGIDGNGFALNLYVHYDVNYVNAFWDGQEMNFGDGDGGQTANPLVSLDVTGHEISHGLTQFTAALNYQGESGAMNEAFSDIMGTAVEFYADSTRANWTVGEDFGTPFRSLSNPLLYGQPAIYQGTYWAPLNGTDNGGVHTNSGVENHWYYLLSQGGTGNGVSVSGLGRTKATAIAWRMQTVYLISSSQFIDARTYSIQAATDLYGACSPEVIATAEAWHAVGVGTGFSGTPTVVFTTPPSGCKLPFSATFTNQSTDAIGYKWYFGDGDSSTAANPTHIYTSTGVYNVTLIANGCTGSGSNNGSFTITPLVAPTISADPCAGGSVTMHATSASGSVQWYSGPTDTSVLSSSNSFTTPSLSSSTTYYVAEVSPSTLLHEGPLDNTFNSNGGYLSNASRALRFQVLQPSKLISVYMYPQNGSPTVTVQYRDTLLTGGTVFASRTVTVPAGGGVVPLDIDLIPSATAVYELGVSAATSLYRNTAGAQYPYDVSGLVSIIGNNIPVSQGANPGYYYFFYDWVVQAPSCVSARTAVQVSCAAGIDDVTAAVSASVYPNPANSQININVQTAGTESVSVRISDMLGREMSTNFYAPKNDLTASVDASTWAAGVYMVEIHAGTHTITKKVTIER